MSHDGVDDWLGTRFSTPATKRRLLVAADLICWPLALMLTTAFYGRPSVTGPIFVLAVVATVMQAIVGIADGLYRGRFRPLSFDEVGAVAVSAGAAGVTAIVVEHLVWNDGRFGQIIVLATSVAVVLMFGHRYVRRLRAHLIMRAADDRQPIIVLGAGDGGYRTIRAMQSVQSSPYRPVALLDDDPHKRQARIAGVRVQGTSDDIARIAAIHHASAVLLALPSAHGDDIQRLHEKVEQAGLETLVMPPVQRLVGEGSPAEITRYRDEDVLNRQIVEIDMTAVRDLVEHEIVLVTGGGGSIGSELCRQLAAFEPDELVILDRDDSLLHTVIASISPDLRDRCTPVLADIRDIGRVDEIFDKYRPNVVFHAAALKHVPALESAPGEGWKTNVLGTANMLSVSESRGVTRFVNISTDKAANPVNVLGNSKRIAERLTAAVANRTRRPYVSVRFGNVIGSRGSAIETFEAQIAAGGPVTITHPDVTRYFMAVREAVRLTMQAATIGIPGEALVLDMGTPVKVIDVAKHLITQSNREIDIEVIGLRPGEKMHEVLLGDGERSDRSLHPMIDHVSVPALNLAEGMKACSDAGIMPSTSKGLSVMAVHVEDICTDQQLPLIDFPSANAPQNIPIQRFSSDGIIDDR